MIGFLRGKVIFQREEFILLDVSGVGYRVFVYHSENYLIDDMVDLWIETYVRDDRMHLYGFQTLEEKNWFQILINVRGVGVRMAMNILGNLSLDVLYQSILTGDETFICRVNGVGKKIASRILQELKSIIPNNEQHLSLSHSQLSLIMQDAVSVLVRLGYDSKKSQEIVNKVKTGSLTDTLRRALQEINSAG